jgi:hypothetical protein
MLAMIIHMQDKGEINILIDDSGAMIAICPICKKIWNGQFSIAKSAPAHPVSRNIKGKINIKGYTAPKNLQHAMPILVSTAKNDSDFLKGVGMDNASIDMLSKF